MPAKTEKQRRFFGAVMGAKKGNPGASGKAKEVAGDMSKRQIQDFLHKESYAQGFIAKCAELGIDPTRLFKVAQAVLATTPPASTGPAQAPGNVAAAPAAKPKLTGTMQHPGLSRTALRGPQLGAGKALGTLGSTMPLRGSHYKWDKGIGTLGG